MMRFSVSLPPTLPRGAALAGLMLGALIAPAPAGAQERFGPLVLANAQAAYSGPAARSNDKRRVDTAPTPRKRRIGAGSSAADNVSDSASGSVRATILSSGVMPWSVGVYR